MSGLNLELFGCAGGMAQGFRRAGIEFDFTFDRDPNAVASYESNLGHRPIQMDVRDLLRLVRGGWRPGPVRLLVADPPCTPWSRAGKREGCADPRDMLRETADLIALLRPRSYLIGNVPGLQDSTSWGVVQEVIGGLVRHGYCVADYAQLDAADYGVPQHRIRPFWYGHLDGPCITWPLPTHGDPAAPPALPGLALQPWVTCRQALGHLAAEDLGRPVRMRVRRAGEDGRKNGGDDTRCSRPDATARTVVAKPDRKGGQILLTGGRHEPSEPSRTLGAKSRGNGACALRLPDPNRPPANPEEPHRSVTGARDQALLSWPWDRPSTTVFSEDRIAPPDHHEGSNLSGPNAVVLPEKAAAILQGFPEDWTFAGRTKSARWSQIGQAMPPGLAEAVARSVRRQMEATAAQERAA